MGSDMMVALGGACVQGQTLFGLNQHAPDEAATYLRRVPGGTHPYDEVIPTPHAALPQARQTCTVLGQQPAGCWGFTHGLNEHQVAVGVTGWYSRLARAEGLTGCDLVRLALERSQSSRQAIDVLTDLIARHGQCGANGDGPTDHVFLIADPAEAYVLEAAGRYWALQECRQTRAVTDAPLTRQDWRRLAPGLATLALEQGWWQDGGSKLDFAGCLDAKHPSHALARRRWGRASVALAQQAGAIDAHFFRHLLDEHFGNNVPLLPAHAGGRAVAFLACLGAGQAVPLAWCAFGPPPFGLFFPVCPLGELPGTFGPPAHPETPTIPQCARQLPALVRAGRLEPGALTEALDRLQTVFDQDADAFLQQARSQPQQIPTLAATMMQRHAEQFDREWRRLHGVPETAEIADWADEEAVPSPY